MSDDTIKRSDAIKALCADSDGVTEIEAKAVMVCLADVFEVLREVPPADRPSGYIHIDDVYRLIAGHSDYHGDSILSAFTCLTEGKEVKPIKPLDRPQGEWIDKGWKGDWQFETDGRGNCWRVFECSVCNGWNTSKTCFCPHCGCRMKGADDESDFES